MVDTVKSDYEVSVETAIRHWEIPLSRLEFATPVATSPAAVKSVLAGTQLTGTVLSITSALAVIDVTPGMVYKQSVRNVLTYAAAAESTFGAINIGDPVYYDRSSTLAADIHLSTSPKDKDGANNALFGYRVQENEADTGALGGAGASTQRFAVMQVGVGH